MRVLDLALKDLLQIGRDRQSAFFLLIMPIAFTLLFGFAFGGFGGDEPADPRLPIGFLLHDDAVANDHLLTLLSSSGLIRIDVRTETRADLEELVSNGELASVVVVPAGYGAGLVAGERMPLEVIMGGDGTTGFAIQGEVETAAARLISAVQAATISTDIALDHGRVTAGVTQATYFNEALARAVAGWANAPVQLLLTETGAIVVDDIDAEAVYGTNAFAHSSPGMMAQFTLAGLLTAAQVLVIERKSGALRRLLTTNMSRSAILAGHYLAMFIMVVVQVGILVVFGQLFLDLPYFRDPLATLLLIGASAFFAASMGLLIGAVAKSEEQAIIFSLIPMFLFAGLGGAWLPLEFTPASFQRIAYLTPVAWMMDGFKDIIVRGLGLESVLVAVAVLIAYGIGFWLLANWRFRFE